MCSMSHGVFFPGSQRSASYVRICWNVPAIMKSLTNSSTFKIKLLFDFPMQCRCVPLDILKYQRIDNSLAVAGLLT